MNTENNTGWSTTLPAVGTLCWFCEWIEEEERYSAPGLVESFGDGFTMILNNNELLAFGYENGLDLHCGGLVYNEGRLFMPVPDPPSAPSSFQGS
jgi:hypothetical protein